MSSEGDESPIGWAEGHSVNNNNVPAMTGLSPDAVESDQSRISVQRRPFLKKGSRMPVSQIPSDPFTPVVKAIKNPPRSASAHKSVQPVNDLDRPRELEDPVPQRAQPASARPGPGRSRRVPDREAEWAHVAAQNTEDLESFLREMTVDEPLNTSSARMQDPVNTSLPPLPPSSRSLDRSLARPRPKSASAVRRKPAPTLIDPSNIEEEMVSKVRELDAQIEKFRKENEYCKRLRMEREVALAEAQRVRERAILELEAAERDIEAQKAQLSTERKRMHQDKDRGHQMVSQLRQLTEENRELKDRIAVLESEVAEKGAKQKSEIVRLNGVISDLSRAKAELELELRAVIQTSATSKPPPPVQTLPLSTSVPTDSAAATLSSTFAHPDGRVDRIFMDGRREAMFPSGLKKTVWPDGAALVRFPNGDVKETSAKGVVTYQYASTGCVQTTHPDGLEVLQFPSGQVEKHFPDGSKEITFPNQIVKVIDHCGRESIIS